MVKQERAVRTRQALIRAAAEVFAHEAYAVASISAISTRAGVSAGALHFHFAGKDDMAKAVEAEAARCVRQLAEGCRQTAGGALECLVQTVFGLLAAAAGDDPVVRAGFRLSVDPSRKCESEMLHWWRDFVHELVLTAQEEGELAQGISADEATTAIVAATVGFEVIAIMDAEWTSVERMAQFWSFILPSLAAAPEGVLAWIAGGDQRRDRVG